MLNEIGDVWNDQDKSPHKAIEALEEARELQPANTASSTSSSRSIRRPRTGRRWSTRSRRSPTARRTRFARASSSTRWRSSIATRRATRIGRSSSSTRRSTSTRTYPRGVRAHQQDPHRAEGLEGARARVPEDAAAALGGQRAEPRPRVQPLAQPRPHLPRPPEGHAERDRGLQDGHALQARRGRRAADPRRALRGDRPDRSRRSASTRSCCRRTRCGSTRTGASTSST